MKTMLNPSQQRAVDHPGANVLIVAGPGTGKTHTLMHRIARHSAELSPEEAILAITFTNKAAQEMRDRLAVHPGRPGQVTVGTFHQFCLNVLKQHQRAAKLPPDIRVATPEEIRPLMNARWPELTRRKINIRLADISRWKSTEALTEEPTADVIAYDETLAGQGWLDYDDLLLKTWFLWRAGPGILAAYQRRFRSVFVDEYQDINPLQHALLIALGADGNRMTAIGDPNQAIYSFRGADVSYFERFTHDFPEADVLNLADNYRSSAQLLDASRQVIEKFNRFGVPPLTAQMFAEGRLVIHRAPTVAAEAEYVTHQIEKLLGGVSMFSQDSGRVAAHEDQQVSFGDIAILYRLNSQQHALRKALDRMGFPYQVTRKADLEDEDELCPLPAAEVHIEAEKISLLTLHAAKGLEFPVVFIVGCEEKLLPLRLEGLPADPEEERRLFYVGMTRAKYQL
ncbi:MAG: ATP-dependent helicase, partial [Candidatus Omnitrophica bacterium]|nr:ATP-dependent helicase [Candidatus Omnitrophota bacterium]